MDDLSRRDTMSFETDTDYDYEDMYYDNPPQEDAEEYSADVSGSIETTKPAPCRSKKKTAPPYPPQNKPAQKTEPQKNGAKNDWVCGYS